MGRRRQRGATEDDMADVWHGGHPMGIATTAFWLAMVAAADPALFSTNAPVELTLRAPLQEIFREAAGNDKFAAEGTLSYRDPASGSDVVIPGVEVSVRGHTSKRESECVFPKLKIKFRNEAARDASIFAGAAGVRIGTHCGEGADEERTPEFGRLGNEKSPLREVFVYHVLEAVGVPTLKARLARITYLDTGTGGPAVVRNAMLLEDEDEAQRRLGGTGQITMEQFTSAREMFNPADTARLAFAEAMIGNFDWCLRLYPGDTYRCDAKLPLWNITAFERREGPALPVIADFDLAGTVVGRHNWFGKVYSETFVPSRSSIEVEVVSQVQRTRSLFARAELDAVRQHFLTRKAAAYEALAGSALDPSGRDLARQYLDAFFAAISDDAFYRPVVSRGTAVYLDAARSREACAPGDIVPPGTPVNLIATDGAMAQVTMLDVHWRWAPPRDCGPMRSAPVWIEQSAITADYPARSRE
jgi:hypothetical protein